MLRSAVGIDLCAVSCTITQFPVVADAGIEPTLSMSEGVRRPRLVVWWILRESLVWTKERYSIGAPATSVEVSSVAYIGKCTLLKLILDLGGCFKDSKGGIE